MLFPAGGGGLRFPLGDETVVGRHPSSDIVLDAPDVSRRHLVISNAVGREYRLRDLDSSNGTFVNGVPVAEHTLAYGDRIHVGAATVLVFTLNDPTEDQLMQRERLEAMGELAAGIAHNFNNLLTIILGNLEYIAEALPPDVELRQAFATTQAAARDGAALVRDLLAASRPVDLPGEDVEPLDLGSLTEEVASLIRRTVSARVEVSVRIEPSVRIMGRRAELHQMLVNLCLNARDAMSDGGELSLVLATCPADPAFSPGAVVRREAVLSVSDTGRGMAPSIAKRVFEPFFTTKPTGTGLGLATVHQTVEHHGGRIHCETAPGRGTTFRIHLPIADAPAAERTTGRHNPTDHGATS